MRIKYIYLLNEMQPPQRRRYCSLHHCIIIMILYSWVKKEDVKLFSRTNGNNIKNADMYT